MPRARKPWSKIVEAAGMQVRVYERALGSVLYREVRLAMGEKDRKSLGHRDRALAEQQARALAQRLGELATAGQVSRLTLGQLFAIYRQHRLPLLSADRQDAVTPILRRLEQHFGRDFAVDDLSQHALDGYVAARKTGAIRDPRDRLQRVGVRAGTVRNEFNVLRAVVRWGQGYRTHGRRLIAGDPLAGVQVAAEKNVRRPVATEERYQALLAIANTVEPSGRFRLLLELGRHTGRRLNAMCQLRMRDLLLTREQLLRGLGAAGMDTGLADHWPHGAIRWSEASDKLGFEAVAPLTRELRASIDAYLRQHPRVGDAPLFPGRRSEQPIAKTIADYWMRRAVEKAKLPKLERGAWHTLRRLWASERRHLPAQDVAAAGGWRSLQVMRSAYQQADAATILEVMQAPRNTGTPPAGHTLDTPAKKA